VSGPYQFRRVNLATTDADADQMAWRLSGHFDNVAQTKADPSFAPVDYTMCSAKVDGSGWPEGTRVTFVRQGISLASGKSIVRVRLYVIKPTTTSQKVMEFFDIDENLLPLADGFCALPKTQRMFPFALIKDSECPMDFEYVAGKRAYVGKTRTQGCASQYQGSQYLTIEGTLKSTQLEIWERWYDAQGSQVAGSKSGPYVYVLKEE
jgi:hypothetical protein